MGQKINPTGFRIGNFLGWKSRWYSDDKNYKDYLLEDIKIRKALMNRLRLAGITLVEIERLPKSMVIILTVSRPGVVIGRGGTGLEDIKRFILEIISEVRREKVKDLKIDLQVKEVKDPELSAHLVAVRVASELERRLPHRRVLAKAMDRVMQAQALGVKIILAGRINGAEISRTEKYHRGSVPNQTLREVIDYSQVPALLKRGYVGVKVYIHKKPEE
ncbi:30S ribosomal protein S3 [Candidatus Woesebacteria bacterium RIFCSPLOWO2_01_FULL_39_61]|uniref:Small ribosomal subunit protein uS3 n=1 Tax=uncultured Microgenomates bacterium Rifle_16ft_4_minimus_37836 TaxID=1665115 RepID=A0A0H4T883_9BACT|nr:30S ribosomal protein S3P, small subunit ribosomal protein S3 [uncultured Microgenomates bacterium Rifle_16ft_4_minimus_37836]OGM28082.1 MAG: 30S ribosomal protein S3 [Candidatus Woesebacteria bacterium RIFCSPHIGHO2_01_FULL_39_95]OGM38329.1 MAG: 30S ribosomal protein S3 [Candidatus Woesebacteria bacterium RIFCSPHIGHO2_12_FULL_40_20]OGM67792.1 MAG: 30S ribosomal protein S3 [Candidatus Woesebacteria bacterium RIFCSPLOWO2_01_FULL_39_61]OGM72740.1 MAG: 30S ribosomal protein S3 [Candidatus Woeseb